MSNDQRIVMPITNSGYGVGEQGQYCTEDSPLRPVSLYGRDKVAAEQIILDRENSVSLRLATVFGMAPRMRIDLLVNDFVYRAVNDRFVVLFEAHFKRNYIHIRDVARAFMHTMGKFADMKGRPFNVGLSDANLSKAELCERIKVHVPNFQYPGSARSAKTPTSAITSCRTRGLKPPATLRRTALMTAFASSSRATE